MRSGSVPCLGAGALRTLCVLLAFVGFGVAWAQFESRGLTAHRAYPGAMPESPAPEPSPSTGEDPEIWLVDGFNVLHASLLGGRDRSEWWTGARRDEVLTLAEGLDVPGGEVWVVFDGPRPVPEREAHSAEVAEVAEAADAADAAEVAEAAAVRQVFAPSADEWLLQRVRRSDDPGRIAVVTADRRVASKAQHRGARVISPRDFLARCRGEHGASCPT